MNKHVYVAGPYTGGDTNENVRNAVEAGQKLFDAGFIPFVPHLYHHWDALLPTLPPRVDCTRCAGSGRAGRPADGSRGSIFCSACEGSGRRDQRVDRLHTKGYEQWMKLDLAWLDKCDALLRLPGESPGSDREVDAAKERGIPVYYSVRAVAFAVSFMAAPVREPTR